MIDGARLLFEMDDSVSYFNASYLTPLLKKQVQAVEKELKREAQPWCITPEDFFTHSERVRAKAARLLGVSANSIAITPSASYGIATAARNIKLGAGEVVILLEAQFPSNVYEWQVLAKEAGAEICTVPQPQDHDWTSAVLETIQRYAGRVRLAALPHVHWASGAVLDLESIAGALRAVRASLVLDLTQSLGAVTIDLAKVRPDFVAAASYKWLLGPYGMGILYARPDYHSGKPLENNWIVRKNSEDFTRLVDYQDAFNEGARRFDMGERAQFLHTPVFETGLDQLLDWGVANIERAIGTITARLAEGFEAMGLDVIAPRLRSPNILGVHMGEKAPVIMSALKAAGVVAGQRADMLRIAPHLWINDKDETRLLDTVRKAL